MSGAGTRSSRGLLNIEEKRQAVIDGLLGLPARIGASFTGMAQKGLLANEAFLQGRGPDGEDLYARPLMPGADTGGRLGALASFVNSNMALGGPAGSLGAGPSLARTANALPMDEASRMARAAEQGFTVPAYHGSPRDLTSINRLPPDSVRARKYELTGESPGMNSLGSWLSSRGDEAGASMYAGKTGTVYPVQARINNPLVIEGGGGKLPDGTDAAFSGLYELIDRYSKGGGSIPNRDMEPVRRALLDQGHDAIIMRNTVGDAAQPQDIYIMLNDGNVRSRFAAFDPAKRNSADLLASYGPNPLAAALYGQPQE